MLSLWFLLLPLAAKASTITTSPEATKTINNRGIVPTTTGQIGVNPVEDELGADNQRGVIQHADTQYIQTEGKTTKWIGVNTEYLSLQTVNPTSTSTVQIAVATVTEAADNQVVGDLSVIIPAGLAKALSDAANEAVNACNALSVKLRKRDAASGMRIALLLVYWKTKTLKVSQCLLNKASSASQDGGIFDIISAANWESFEVKIAQDAPQLLAAAWQVLKTKAIRNRFALFMGAVNAVVILGAINEAVPIGKYIFSQNGIGKPTPSGGGNNGDKKCTGQEKKDKDSPLCKDDDCKGTNEKCTVDPNKNCPCLDTLEDPEPQWYDQKELDAQQNFFKEIDKKPSENPGESKNNAKAIDAWSELGSGPAGKGQKVQPRDLFYLMRDSMHASHDFDVTLANCLKALCNNKCEKAQKIDPDVQLVTQNGYGCEIAIGMSRGVELYAYRALGATSAQQQDCWDSFASIIDNKIQNGPNAGWVNGPDPGEYFEAGVRNNDASRPAWSHQGAMPSKFIRPSEIRCDDASCNGPKHGPGTCAGNSQHPNLMCCNNDFHKCDGSENCNPSDGQCTGKQNGCLCSFNGGRARGLPEFAAMREA